MDTAEEIQMAIMRRRVAENQTITISDLSAIITESSEVMTNVADQTQTQIKTA